MRQLPVLKNKLVKLPHDLDAPEIQDAKFRVLPDEEERTPDKIETRIIFDKVRASREIGMFLIGFVLGAMLVGSFYIEHKETHNCQAIHGAK